MDSEKKGRELLEMFFELSGTDSAEVRRYFKEWIQEFGLDEDNLTTNDLRVLTTCFLERVSADILHDEQDSDSYFMLPQA